MQKFITNIIEILFQLKLRIYVNKYDLRFVFQRHSINVVMIRIIAYFF